jgi:hypothetical protein
VEPGTIDGAEMMRASAGRVLVTRSAAAAAAAAAAAVIDTSESGAAADGTEPPAPGSVGSTPLSQTSDPEEGLVVRTRDDSSRLLVAFARVFSGTLRLGDRIHILGPRCDRRLVGEGLWY